MTEKLASLIVSFVHSTCLGQERRLYRTIRAKMFEGLKVDDMKKDSFSPTLTGATADYMNGCYKSLIVGDDEYVTSKFKEMTDTCGHSEICLLNIVTQCILMVYDTIVRDMLDVSSLEAYENSWERQFSVISRVLSGPLSKTLSHECNGIDIKTCNPDEPMFHTSRNDKLC